MSALPQTLLSQGKDVVSVMNNCVLTIAHRLTHIKIVALSLIAVCVVVGVGKAARPELPGISARAAARTPVLKAVSLLFAELL